MSEAPDRLGALNGPTGLAERKTASADFQSSASAAVHGKRRDSLLLELKLTLKIAQRNVILKDLTPTLGCLRSAIQSYAWL